MRMIGEQQVAKWERVRTGGRRRFIVRHGMIGWGVSSAVLSTILTAWLAAGAANWVVWLAIALVVFPLGGFVWGATFWRLSEAAYVKSRAAAPPPGAAG